MDKNTQQINWINYTVTIIIGLAFSVIILVISWNNALETEKREYTLASSSIKDTVSRNVKTANDTLDSLTAFIEVNPDINQQQFSEIVLSLLGMHPFMEGAVYSVVESNDAGIKNSVKIQFSTMRDSNYVNTDFNIEENKTYENTMEMLSETDSTITMASNYMRDDGKDYWIMKMINVNSGKENKKEQSGFISILINTNKLIGANFKNSDLSVTLLSDSASLSGRQMLYQKITQVQNRFTAADFVEEGITQFPLYSVKLSIKGSVPLDEVDKSMIYISFLISLGVVLLLTALLRVKDKQEVQLRERNMIIEAQVALQTKELALARDGALRASRMKSSFLAGMSHEIRTPLNAIIGMSDLLSETSLDFEQKKYVGVFKRAGDNLLSLVNDILDLSKVEANQLVLEKIEFNLIDMVEESIEIYALKAAEKEVELICWIDPAVNPIRMGDPSRLRQIVLNLISNALKFTEIGEIVLKIDVDSQKYDDQCYLKISVKDSGIGIPIEKLEAIFTSFTQVDSSTTRKYGGTGLGLTISRSLVQMMGGKIWVESEINKGSRFIFTVNLPVPNTEKVSNNSCSDRLRGKNITVVDDNLTVQGVLESYLESRGATISSFFNGHEFQNYVGEKSDNSLIDLIILDSKMPNIDGFQLAENLQKIGLTSPFLFLLNPATLNENTKKLKILGAESFITKPVKMNDLLQHVERLLLGGGVDNELAQSTESVDRERPLDILLVDDNPDNRLLVSAYLKKLPYTLVEAENGEEAVNKFMTSNYDVVLMDVQMPVMDGREATRKIREWESQNGKRRTPIIALTAHAIKEEIDLCIEAGCDLHLSKPVKKSTLISTINTCTVD